MTSRKTCALRCSRAAVMSIAGREVQGVGPRRPTVSIMWHRARAVQRHRGRRNANAPPRPPSAGVEPRNGSLRGNRNGRRRRSTTWDTMAEIPASRLELHRVERIISPGSTAGGGGCFCPASAQRGGLRGQKCPPPSRPKRERRRSDPSERRRFLRPVAPDARQPKAPMLGAPGVRVSRPARFVWTGVALRTSEARPSTASSPARR